MFGMVSAMKIILVFLASIAVAAAVEGYKPGLRVKFGVVGPNSKAGESFFFDISRTVPEAIAAGWKCTQRPAGHLPQLVMYCPEEKVMCGFYDDTDYIAGVQVALSKSESSETVFDWEKRGFIPWCTTVDGKPKSFWTIQQYFVDDEFLAISKEKRLASRDSSRTLQAGAVWVTANQKLQKISNQQADIVREKLFLKQACIPGMGQHYYYNLSTTTECTWDQMYPWFLMTVNGELSATAFFTLGKLEVPRGRDWFERSALALVKNIIPYGPQCMYDLVANPGSLTMHFHFVDKPWTITCPA